MAVIICLAVIFLAGASDAFHFDLKPSDRDPICVTEAMEDGSVTVTGVYQAILFRPLLQGIGSPLNTDCFASARFLEYSM